MNRAYLKKMRAVEFDYTNYKGESGKRRAQIVSIFYGSNKWHTEEQWLLEAYDMEKQDFRFFAMNAMKNVQDIKL
jgi:predicted DNA-binding transcriptional regulator YafY